MAKSEINTHAAYIAAQPKPAQAALKRVREIVGKTLRDAEEVISYKIPAFRHHGRVALWYAGWAEHYSIYPVFDRVLESFKGKLPPHKKSKGTVRLPLAEPVPEKLIAHIAKSLSKAAEARTKARAVKKTAARKKKVVRKKKRK